MRAKCGKPSPTCNRIAKVKNQYVEDINDYRKYGLIRILSNSGIKNRNLLDSCGGKIKISSKLSFFKSMGKINGNQKSI